MHPLRLLLYISVALAVTVAVAFGATLLKTGVPPLDAYVLAALVFAVFMLPWTGVFVWAVRRARGLDMLVERTHAIVAGDDQPSVTGDMYREEVEDLARGIEELRVLILREKVWSAEQRAMTQQIVAALGEGLLAFNPKGRIVFANDRVREMFAASSDLVGRRLVEVVRNQRLIDAFQRTLNGEASVDRITVGSRGSERQIESRVFPVANSTEVAAVALFIDVTDIERLQRIRKDFLDDFSHEVRTPLAGLRSAAETLQDGGVTADEERQLREIVFRQLGRIEHLVRDLSELNRIESGELILERRPSDLLEMLRQISGDFSERLTADKLKLTIRGPRTVADVDPARAQQIFTNLIDNAWKHGGGGEVLIELSREADGAVVNVSDRGEGIPEEDIDRIFNRFYRVDKSRSQSVPGTGLGLAIAKHLVLLHGGTIQAFNRSGGGATFEVRLPAGEEEAAPPAGS